MRTDTEPDTETVPSDVIDASWLALADSYEYWLTKWAGTETPGPPHPSGKRTVTVVPAPSWLSTAIVPPCCSTM